MIFGFIFLLCKNTLSVFVYLGKCKSSTPRGETIVSALTRGGVWFCDGAQKKAEELDIHGWVRNEPDESVMIEASGNPEDIEQFVLWCHRGPEFAEVETEPHENQDWSAFVVR